MASFSVTAAKSATLTGTTVDTITITREALIGVEVWNRTGSADLSFTFGTTPATPTDKGDDCYVVAPGSAVTVSLPAGERRATIDVKVIGSSNAYTVTGIV